MLECPNCSYKLVLLSHRRKYKCAKCSKVFLQKDIEINDFQRYNKFQRQMDKDQFVENFKKQWLEYKKQFTTKLSKEEIQKRKKEYYNKWRSNNLDKTRETDREYHNKNKDKINTKRRLRYKENKQYNLKRKARRHKNIELTRLQSRIDYWKSKQKLLADRLFKNKLYTASNTKIVHSVPTFLLCEQLSNQ